MEQQLAKEKDRRYAFILIGIFVALIAIMIISISVGSVHVAFTDVVKIICGQETEHAVDQIIVMNIRLPRVLATLIGGASLAVSGLLLQIFFRNPIVEPYVLGISSGASLFVGMIVLGGVTFGFKSVPPLFLFMGAFIGAMLVMVVVVIASKKVKNVTTLLIIGIMTGFICGAMTSMMTAFADKEQIANYAVWLLGSFAGFSWVQTKFLYLLASPVIVVTFLMSKPLNAMLFGENYAVTMGVNIKRFRVFVILISSILTASITAFAGPISFVGLAVPHIVRIIFHTSNNRILIPGVVMLGGCMTALCDLGARMLLAPVELPLSSITALIGAPLVVYLLIRKKNQL